MRGIGAQRRVQRPSPHYCNKITSQQLLTHSSLTVALTVVSPYRRHLATSLLCVVYCPLHRTAATSPPMLAAPVLHPKALHCTHSGLELLGLLLTGH